MTKKILLSIVILFLFIVSCTKYFDGITDFKNWNIDWTPNFGVAILNANISYNDLKQMIPTDSNFTVSEGADGILILNANQNIISAINDFFELQNLNYDIPTEFIIGGISSQSFTIQIPLTQLINLKGVTGSIQSIKFNGGIINLNVIGSGAQNISSISASLGNASSGEIKSTNNEEIIVPINLKDQSIHVTNDNINLSITINIKPNTIPLKADIRLNSQNLDLNAITINNFSYSPKPIETTLSMNFFESINNNNPNFQLDFIDPVKLSVNFNNQSNLSVTLQNLKATYYYKNGDITKNDINITGSTHNQTLVFDVKNISNLLTKVVFTTDPVFTPNINPIIISKTSNVELRGSIEIPLNVNIQNLTYEKTLSLPKITDTKILDALEQLTIKTFSDNGFPVELTCILQSLNEAGTVIESINLENIVKSKNASTTISIDNEKIRNLISTGKGKIILGIATHNTDGQPGAGKFTTQDKLSLRLGISIKANGKEILQSL